jgi:type I restriction enzyme S subunit
VTAKQLERRRLRLGDILLEKSGGGPKQPVGRVVFVDEELEDAVCANFVQLVRADPELVEPRYLFYLFWLSHLSGESLQFQAATTGIRNLRTKDYLARKVALPSLETQRRAVAVLDGMYDTSRAAARVAASAEEVYLASLRERFDALTSRGQSVSLGDVAELTLGKMLSGVSKTGVDEFPYLRNADVQWDALRFSDIKTMNFSPEQQEKFSLHAGDVLVCEGGEVGRSAVVEADLDGIFYQKALHRVRVGDSLLPRFFMHYMRYCSLTGRFAALSSQLTIAHLTQEKLQRLDVPVAALAEQDALVAMLDSAMASARAAAQTARCANALRASAAKEFLPGELSLTALACA